MKALVICGDSIADTVFSTPVIRALKVQLEDAKVDVCVSAATAFLMEENPYVDNVYRESLSFFKDVDFFERCGVRRHREFKT